LINQQLLKHPIWYTLSRAGFYAPFIAFYAVALPLLTFSRALLCLWQLDHFEAIALTEIFINGLRADLILLGLMSLIPLLLSPIFALFKAWEAWQKLSYYWLIIAVVFIIFMEAVTPGFMAEYSTRPNRLFIEYLKYPKEVLPMLWKGFKLPTLMSLGLLLPVVFILMVLSIRSTLGHRPANPAFFAVTDDALVNDLILNSTHTSNT